MSELPDGWTITNLNELFEFKYGKGLVQEKRNPAGSVNVYGSNGIVGKHDKAFTLGTTIIVGRKGSVGEVNLSTDKCWAIDTTYYIDDFAGELPPNYWAWYLKSLRLGQQEKSSAIPGISRDDIYSIDVLLPPLNEQRCIVEKLEELLSLVDAARMRLATLPRTLKQFRQSILAAACSGKLTADWRKEPRLSETAGTLLARVRLQRRERWTQAEMAKQTSKGKESRDGKRADKYPDPRKIVDDDLPELPEQWVWASLDEVSHRLTYGITIRPEYVEDGVSMISAREIRSGEVDLLKANRISRSDYDDLREKCRIHFGDVLFSKTGTIGSVARVKTKEPLCSSQNIAVISPLVDPAFLEIVLRSSTIQQRAQGAVKNTAVSDLQLGIMARFPIPIPPLNEQKEIVRRVEALFKTADALEARYRTAKAHVDKLTQSILAKAFRGELVPQDPNDEPASVLLDRIRSSRSDAASRRAKRTSC